MNLRLIRVCRLFFISFLIVSCSNLEFFAGGKTPLKISADKNSEKNIEYSSTQDFYFWGKSPGSYDVDLDDIALTLGIDQASHIVVSQSTSWKSLFYTILTLGLYSPVDYQISGLTKKEVTK